MDPRKLGTMEISTKQCMIIITQLKARRRDLIAKRETASSKDAAAVITRQLKELDKIIEYLEQTERKSVLPKMEQ